jgi:hypothetical protein
VPPGAGTAEATPKIDGKASEDEGLGWAWIGAPGKPCAAACIGENTSAVAASTEAMSTLEAMTPDSYENNHYLGVDIEDFGAVFHL